MQIGGNGAPVEDVTSLANLAVRHLQRNELVEALAAFQRLVAIRPYNPDDWFNLGYLYRCMRQFQPALDAYEKALALGVSQPEEAHVNRAAIFLDHMDRSEEARIELEKALSLNPRYLTAWLNLGNLHEDCGRPAEARATYCAALDVDPNSGRAHARISAIDIVEGNSAQAVVNLQRGLALPGNHLDDTAEMQFALGHALDDQGRFDEAAIAFHTANGLAYARMPLSQRYNPQWHAQYVEEIQNAFHSRDRATSSDTTAPIFICGMFRSGSTLAEQILSRHSRVTAGGELEFMPAIVASRMQPYPEAAQALSQADLTTLANDYKNDLRKLRLDGGIFTDKRPDNFLHIGLIKSIFPNAKIIHTHRHILDNILSIYFLYFADSVNYGFRIADIVHYIDQYRKLMRHWKSVYPDDIFDLNYDLIVKDPEAEIRKLLEFCQIEWEPECLIASPSSKAVKTASSWQVRQPLYTKSSGRWTNYEKLLSQYVDTALL